MFLPIICKLEFANAKIILYFQTANKNEDFLQKGKSVKEVD